MHRALSLPPSDDAYSRAPSALTGILTHLDVVYGFALTLTGDTESAEQIAEDVFASIHDDLWTTLGGHSLRDRLLARCVTAFRAAMPSRLVSPTADALDTLLLGLPWDERAAIALVDQLGLTYAAGAAVLGIEVAEFRARLHRARSVLFAAYRVGAR